MATQSTSTMSTPLIVQQYIAKRDALIQEILNYQGDLNLSDEEYRKNSRAHTKLIKKKIQQLDEEFAELNKNQINKENPIDINKSVNTRTITYN